MSDVVKPATDEEIASWERLPFRLTSMSHQALIARIRADEERHKREIAEAQWRHEEFVRMANANVDCLEAELKAHREAIAAMVAIAEIDANPNPVCGGKA